MKTKEIIELTNKYVMNTYTRIPIAPVEAKGVKLVDADGKEYLDFVAGLAVNSTGHSHDKVASAICNQAKKLIHTSNLYNIEPQAKLAQVLVENSCFDKVFFCNSGAEANEAAIKLAKRYAKEVKQSGAYEIITASRSFHGRTLATVTATGQTKYQKGFDPLTPGFKYVAYNDLDALKEAVSDKTCAVMLEPVQGEGGVYPADPEYMRGVRKLCDEKGMLLIFDEVQTGVGRCGKLFAYELFDGVTPDIMTLAKGLASGVPIGATLATEEAAKGFVPGTHASTFGGNFLASTAALATLDIILGDGILDNVRITGDYLKKSLSGLAGKYSIISEIRGYGLMVGVQLTQDTGNDIIIKCRDKGLLLNCIGGNVLRFVPPLVVSKADIDDAVKILDDVLSDL